MWNTFFERDLASLEEQGLLRDLHILPKTGEDSSVPGRTTLNFSSNDYLGLATDQRLKDAAIQAVNRFGSGSTASRLLAGHMAIHEELESDLARMMGTETALVFGSGFLTNIGVLSALAAQGDEIFSDWLNHASLIDGIRLSRADCSRYQHKDLDHVEDLLRKSKTTGKKIIVSESLFSMDGDIAPVKGLAELAERYEALLVIDEAHAIGVMGSNGGGICRIPGHEVRPDIVIGTLSKALGGYGGFVACSRLVRQFLINRTRSFIFSTGLPPACAGSGREAVAIVAAHPEMGQTLMERARWFHGMLAESGLNVMEFESQILPILIGGNEEVSRFSEVLMKEGLLIKPIRPPTIPVGTSRVRLSMTLSMTVPALEEAATVIVASARTAGIL